MSKVFGATPRIVHERQGGGTLLVIGTIAPASAKEPAPPESFTLQVAHEHNSAEKYDEVLLRGADMRGTIYAIYTFSQEVLGVDPMYLWTDHEPKRQTVIELPGDYSRSDPGPSIASAVSSLTTRTFLLMGACQSKRAQWHFTRCVEPYLRDDSAPQGKHGGSGNLDLPG